MWKNYLKTAWRTLTRRRSYAFLNIAGLAVGMACCLLIVFFVHDELSHDRFHTDADRIHRIVSAWGSFSVPATNPPFLRALRTERPDLDIAQLMKIEGTVRRDERAFRERRVYFGNAEMLEVFSFPLQKGDAETALTRPFTVVLTEATAQKYFPGEDPIGQTITVDDQFELEVTGIAENVPAPSHFHFDFLISWATLDAAFDYSSSTNWGNNSIYTYLLFPEGTSPGALETQFREIINRHAGADWNGATLQLQPLTDIHLRSQHNMELEANGRAAYVWLFGAIAVFILLIACVNFMNLATARSAERAREVGVRKAVGARREQLVGQFLAESLLLAFTAALLALALAALALPVFQHLTGKPMGIAALADGGTLGILAAIALVVGLSAGSYPALVLSRHHPIVTLRGQRASGTDGALLRKGLVVFQFAISVALIAGTAVVYGQLDYLRSASLGFDQEQVLVIPTQTNPTQQAALNARYPAFREALLAQPGVQQVSIASEGLPSELLNGTGAYFEGAPPDEAPSLRTVAVGHGFFETLGVEVVAGRGHSDAFPTDSSAFVVNEAALALLNAHASEAARTPEAALGTTVQVGADRQGPLLGVTEDFNMATLHETIEPIIFYMRPDWYDTYLVRLTPGDAAPVLAEIGAVWERFNPGRPFEYRFADQAFDAQYRAEERLTQIFAFFAGLAIFIACLGLFGLAAHTAERRTKELGIRKVLGASVPGLVGLLSKDFVRLVVVAFVLAAPLAYLGMARWLDGFAYRIAIRPWMLLGAGALALVIALLTVSIHALRAATRDPVQSLRYE